PDKTKELRAAVRKIAGNDPDVANPSINLEQFFLKVVKEAHDGTGKQSGVTTSENIAEFLDAKNND
ncbi:hypothetical protein BVX94_02170, partial [bacterium B17]